MKAAEHMAIRFALDRYQKGEVRVNAVHQMMEHIEPSDWTRERS